MTNTRTKLDFDGPRTSVSVDEASSALMAICHGVGCDVATATVVSEHLIDASLSGVESHGVMRILQYAEQFRSGYLSVSGTPEVTKNDRGGVVVTGNGGIGIPALTLAVDHACSLAGENGVAALAVKDVGHTGRLGAFAEQGACKGNLVIIIGGAGRHNWRQVAPYGGRKALLPTNPYCIGIPGGDRGPVVLDFATSKIAGGWIYAARSAGAKLPEGMLIDRNGNSTTEPEDYFNGGAILPSGEAKGYALAVAAEMIAEAMLGPATTECNWLVTALDTTRFREPSQMRMAAEDVLSELRTCPPAPGFDKVEIPGERERDHKAKAAASGIALPLETWRQIQELARSFS